MATHMKGAAVRLVVGKYAGKRGWYDDQVARDDDSVAVIIVNLKKKDTRGPTFFLPVLLKIQMTNQQAILKLFYNSALTSKNF